MKRPFRCLVLGAAGRDFHDAQRFFRDEPRFELVAFTAAQIPSIDARSFPGAFVGYPSDIPVRPERELEALVRELDIDVVLLSYSDLPHEDVRIDPFLGTVVHVVGTRQSRPNLPSSGCPFCPCVGLRSCAQPPARTMP